MHILHLPPPFFLPLFEGCLPYLTSIAEGKRKEASAVEKDKLNYFASGFYRANPFYTFQLRNLRLLRPRINLTKIWRAIKR